VNVGIQSGSTRLGSSRKRGLGDRIDQFVGSVLARLESIRLARHTRPLFELAELVATARQPEVIESALVRLAAELGGACRVELWLDRDEQALAESRLIALWTESGSAMTETEIDALGYPLTLGLWCGENYQMTIQLYASTVQAKKRWTPALVRRLNALCAVAAAAERGLHVSQRGRIESPQNTKPTVRDATFLNAMLPYALAQAHRHREPLTLICVELDQLGSVYRSHGPEVAGASVHRAAESIARALRESDVVARLDDDRLIVVLPDAGGPSALTVAEKVRSAILKADRPNDAMPVFSASLGVACFPIDATEMLALVQAADDAMALAKARGGNQIAAISLPPPISLHQAPKVDDDTWQQHVG
jgi:diguanylate cyclase (GGDEF)-like protein